MLELPDLWQKKPRINPPLAEPQEPRLSFRWWWHQTPASCWWNHRSKILRFDVNENVEFQVTSRVFFSEFVPLLRFYILLEASQEIFDRHHKQFQNLVVSKILVFAVFAFYFCNMHEFSFTHEFSLLLVAAWRENPLTTVTVMHCGCSWPENMLRKLRDAPMKNSNISS